MTQSSCLYLFLFFIVFYATRTGRTACQIWTNDGSKCIVPYKNLPFGHRNHVALNFGGQIPHKLIFFLGVA